MTSSDEKSDEASHRLRGDIPFLRAISWLDHFQKLFWCGKTVASSVCVFLGLHMYFRVLTRFQYSNDHSANIFLRPKDADREVEIPSSRARAR